MLSLAISLLHKQRPRGWHATEETRWKGQKTGGLLILGCRMGGLGSGLRFPPGENYKPGYLRDGRTGTVSNTQATLTSSPAHNPKQYTRAISVISCWRQSAVACLSSPLSLPLLCIEITARPVWQQWSVVTQCFLLIITLEFQWALETEVGMWPLASCSLLKCAVEVTGAGCIWDMKLFLCVSRI